MAQGSDRRPRWLDLIGVNGRDDGPGPEPTVADLRAAIAETRADLARHLGALKQHLFHPQIAHHESASEIDMATTKKKAARPSASKGGSSKTKAAARPSSTAKGRDSAAAGTTKPAADRKTAATPTKTKSKAKTSSTNPSRPASASSTKSKRSTAKASASRSKSGSARKPAAKSLLAKTGEVLDTMVAGAMVGAITGAAQTVAGQPTAVTAAEPQAMNSSPAAVGGPGAKEVLGEMAGGAAVGGVSGAAKAVLPPRALGQGRGEEVGPQEEGGRSLIRSPAGPRERRWVS